MSEAIQIPSPTAFLRPSPDDSTLVDPPPPRQPAPKRQNSSPDTKKKAARKSAAAGVDANNAATSVVKPRQSKSRNGCLTCKQKRLKCGEEKPSCQQCARRNVECGGYKKDFKWRPFEETTAKLNIDKQRRAASPSARLVPPRPVSSDGARRSEARHQKSKSEGDGPSRTATPLTSAPALPTTSFNLSADQLQPGSLSHLAPGRGLSPTITEILLPVHEADPAQQDFVQFRLPDGFHFQPLPGLTPLEGQMMQEGGHGADGRGLGPDVDIDRVLGPDVDVDRVLGPDVNDDRVLGPDVDDRVLGPDVNDDRVLGPDVDDRVLPDMPMPIPSGHNTPMTPQSTCSDGGQLYISPRPRFAPDSAEMLAWRFDRLTCGILSIMDGPGENPWRSLVWPLAQQCPALYHAITAMAAFHYAHDVPRMRLVGQQHKAASIQFIREGIRDTSMSYHTAIATALALGLAEAWDVHTSTGNTHIKGAQALVRHALQQHRQNPLRGVELARLKFLCNAWVYMDVIARLTSIDSDDESNDFDNAFLFSSGHATTDGLLQMVHGTNSHDGFGIDFGMPIDARLDPLMGCANTLFPLIGRVANLVRKVCRSLTNSPAVISQANELKTLLEHWDPPAYIEPPHDPTTDVEHALQTAEAYRWATLLHLHSAVPELPSMSRRDLAHRVLQYLATVPLSSRTLTTHLYPLMAAGAEAHDPDDRAWVRARWARMTLRMRLGVLPKCARVAEEVWRRRDVYVAQPPQARRLVATADLLPADRAHVRSPGPAGPAADPGRSGVVFSFVAAAAADDDVPGRNGGPPAAAPEENPRARERRNGRDPRLRWMDPAYTVRGHLHWVGVMWDWQWQILLG